MSTPVNLPALGESVTEGTITRWLKQVGDTVEVDEPLLEVSTDKVDTEIPSPVAGTLLEIKAEEDETVEVGAELCVIGDEGEGGGSETPTLGGAPTRTPRTTERSRGGRARGRAPRTTEESEDDDELRRRGLRGRGRAGRGRPSRRGAGDEEEKPAAKRAAAAAVARRSRCPRWASRSPRAPSPAG